MKGIISEKRIKEARKRMVQRQTEAIVNEYSEMVYRLAYSQMHSKVDADDVYQEVFLRYIKKRPIFENKTHEKAWFIRVTINCCKKMWSSSWFKRIVPLTEDISFMPKEYQDLYRQLERLPRKYRMVIHLYYYEELSSEEIAQLLTLKPSTVRTQLTRGRKKLREILEGESLC